MSSACGYCDIPEFPAFPAAAPRRRRLHLPPATAPSAAATTGLPLPYHYCSIRPAHASHGAAHRAQSEVKSIHGAYCRAASRSGINESMASETIQKPV